jgi:uncharacterized protein YPO0396
MKVTRLTVGEAITYRAVHKDWVVYRATECQARQEMRGRIERENNRLRQAKKGLQGTYHETVRYMRKATRQAFSDLQLLVKYLFGMQ